MSTTTRRHRAVSEEDKSARRDQILMAAKKVFARKGFHATTIADVAKESGWLTGRSTGISTPRMSYSTR
ncbi:bacterial regulatory s, tetR family protein [Mycobacterium xenopi 3993]|nr:bacterial regulatory s, tetR family protein [Mycobacterium xenopi 3993]